MIDLSTATYFGPTLNDQEALDMLPEDYREFLLQTNGCVLFGGGLHIRGFCDDPDWHSLRRAWIGDDSFHALYPEVREEDIPFAQDVLGDQFLLRAGSVVRLRAETGEIEECGIGLMALVETAAANPVGFLSLRLLQQFQADGRLLQPGELLNVYPPLCTQESSEGVSLRAVPALSQIRFLADFAAQISALPDGSRIRIRAE
jgi:hypothetical protein